MFAGAPIYAFPTETASAAQVDDGGGLLANLSAGMKRGIARFLQAVRGPEPAPVKKKIVPNRTVPKVTPPVLEVAFGDTPTTDEIMRARVLPEPLRPVAVEPSPDENRAMASMLEAYAQVGFREGAGILERFVETNVPSPWRPSILANLGVLRAQDGYFTRAARYWEEAWEVARHSPDARSRAVADFAIGEWLTQAAMFGQTAVLEARLTQLKERPARGDAGNKVRAAKEAFWFLTNKHEFAIFSGPEALKVYVAETAPGNTKAEGVISAYRPPHEGTSLSALRDLARSVGAPLEMRFVTEVAQIPVPSIVHLKSEHYSTVVARRDGGVVVKDAALGEMFFSAAAFRDEASGYVLGPSSVVRGLGRAVATEEAAGVLGHCLSGAPYDEEGCRAAADLEAGLVGLARRVDPVDPEGWECRSISYTR